MRRRALLSGGGIVALAALAGGCMIPFLFLPMRSGLTASVVGVVGKADIHEVAGDYYEGYTESFFAEHGNRRGQVLHVRLSTRRDLVSFIRRKHLMMTASWHFCDDARREFSVGGGRIFVNGVLVVMGASSGYRKYTNGGSVWKPVSTPSPARDGNGRFAYDTILYVRTEARRHGSDVGEAFDLEREPRDVCVAVWLTTKPAGYFTKAARIPKEEIAAALGVAAPSASLAELDSTTR